MVRGQDDGNFVVTVQRGRVVCRKLFLSRVVFSLTDPLLNLFEYGVLVNLGISLFSFKFLPHAGLGAPF